MIGRSVAEFTLRTDIIERSRVADSYGKKQVLKHITRCGQSHTEQRPHGHGSDTWHAGMLSIYGLSQNGIVFLWFSMVSSEADSKARLRETDLSPPISTKSADGLVALTIK